MSEQKRDYLNESLTLIRKREVQQAFDDGIEAGMRRAVEMGTQNDLRLVRAMTDDAGKVKDYCAEEGHPSVYCECDMYAATGDGYAAGLEAAKQERDEAVRALRSIVVHDYRGPKPSAIAIADVALARIEKEKK